MVEVVERPVELREHEGRRRRAIAGQAQEVPVEVGLEPGRVLAFGAALLDPVAQCREELFEVRGLLVGYALVGRVCRLLVGHDAECSRDRPRTAEGSGASGHGRTAKSAA